MKRNKKFQKGSISNTSNTKNLQLANSQGIIHRVNGCKTANEIEFSDTLEKNGTKFQLNGDLRMNGIKKMKISESYDSLPTLNGYNNTTPSWNSLEDDDTTEEFEKGEIEEESTLVWSTDDTTTDEEMSDMENDPLLSAEEYWCTICKEKFSDDILYKQHLLAFHKQGREYKCAECKRIFDNLTEYRKHIKIHPDYPDEERGNEGNLDSELYVCKSCKIILNGKNEFLTHCYDKHPTKRIKIKKLQEDSEDEYIIEGKSFRNTANNYESDSSSTSYDRKEVTNGKIVNSLKRTVNERRRSSKLLSKQVLKTELNDNSLEEKNGYLNGDTKEINENNCSTGLGGCNGSEESIVLNRKKDENKDKMTLDELYSVLDAKEDDLDNIMNEQKVNDISTLYKNISKSNNNGKEIKEEENVNITRRKEEDYMNVDIPFELEIAQLQMNNAINLSNMMRTEDTEDSTESIDIENIIIKEDKTIAKPTLTIIKRQPYKEIENVKSIIESSLVQNKNKKEILNYQMKTKESLLKAKLKYGQNNINTTIRNRPRVLPEDNILKRELLKSLEKNKEIIITKNRNFTRSHVSDRLIKNGDLNILKMNDTKKELGNKIEMTNQEILSTELHKLGIVNSTCLEMNKNLDEEMKLVKSIISKIENIKPNKIINENRNDNILKIPSKPISEHEEFKRTINSNYFSKIDSSSWKNIKNTHLKNNLMSGIYRKSKNELNEKDEAKMKKELELYEKFAKKSGVYKINHDNNNISTEINSKVNNNIEIWYKKRRIPIKIKQTITENNNNLELINLKSTENVITEDDTENTKNLINQINTSSQRFEEKKEISIALKIDEMKNELNNIQNRPSINTMSNSCEETEARLLPSTERVEKKSFKTTSSNRLNMKDNLKNVLNGSLSVLEEFERYSELEDALNNQELDFEGDALVPDVDKRTIRNHSPIIEIEYFERNKRQKLMEQESNEETREIKEEIYNELRIKEEKIIEDETRKLITELDTRNNHHQNAVDDLAPFLELDYMLSHGLRTDENGGDILLDITHRIIDRLE